MLRLEKDDLASLTDGQLRELIARLCEAEVEAAGLSRSCVRWGGAQTAPDGGLDVEVNAQVSDFPGHWLKRPWCGLQAKKGGMPPAEIHKEMRPGGELRPVLEAIGKACGSYLLVSLEDVSAVMLENRRKAMREAVEDASFSDQIHLDFVGRNDLLRWIDLYPGVETWVREKIGKPLSGWRPYGRWSQTPVNCADTLILDDGVRVRMPTDGAKHDLETGIAAIRELVKSSDKAIRIVGLSGLGKTRLVQALFEEGVGGVPLPASKALYADLGGELAPTARQMIDSLIEKKADQIVILDNCSPEAHNAFSQTLAASATSVRLITVEYDVRDDKPEQTSVVSVVAHGTDAVEKLLLRRHPQIGELNARSVAEFSQGNARVALALADRIDEGENISKLSSEELFLRLFAQRHEEDKELLAAAEVMSLVYSFSVETEDDGASELKHLAELNDGASHLAMSRHVETLSGRGIVQSRGRWRAVLPQAVSNRLAARALSAYPFDELMAAFEERLPRRMLLSFAHRIGYLHDHAVAQRIMRRWLSPGGTLSDPANYKPDHARILTYAAAAAPSTTFEAIKRWLADDSTMSLLVSDAGSIRTTIVGLLEALAYEAADFEQAVACLTKLAAAENADGQSSDTSSERLANLFSPVLSGTIAPLEQRAEVLEALLGSVDAFERGLACSMLAEALSTSPWSNARTFEFGAWARDYGYIPRTSDDWINWYSKFLDLAANACSRNDPELRSSLSSVLAGQFRGLWRVEPIRDRLEKLAGQLSAEDGWTEGWTAANATLNFDYRDKGEARNDAAGRERLCKLIDRLEPRGLIPEIRALTLEKEHRVYSVLDTLGGENFKEQNDRLNHRLRKLGDALSSAPSGRIELFTDLLESGNNFSIALGEGLFRATEERARCWADMLAAADRAEAGWQRYGLFLGAVKAVANSGDPAAHEYLDEVAKHPNAKRFLVELQSLCSLDERALGRIQEQLNQGPSEVWRYERVFWSEPYLQLPDSELIDLCKKIVAVPDGTAALLRGFAARAYGEKKGEIETREKLAEFALNLASGTIAVWDELHNEDRRDVQAIVDRFFDPTRRSGACAVLLQKVIEFAKRKHGHLFGLEKILARIVHDMPVDALNALFEVAQSDGLQVRGRMSREKFEDAGPVSAVPTGELVAWAVQSEPEARFLWISGLLWPFATAEKGELCVSDAARAVLDAAPNPSEVVERMASAIEPMSWSGSRADIVERRFRAFSELKSHPSNEVRTAIEDIRRRVEEVIRSDRVREAREDQTRESTFE